MRMRRVMQRSLAVGWAGMLGWMMIPGAPVEARAEEERADQALALGRAGGEEGLWAQDLTPEEREALKAVRASTVGGASQEGNSSVECEKEPWTCKGTAVCHFPGDDELTSCTTVKCSTGSCPICPEHFGNLAIKAWCLYECKKGAKLVGTALRFRTYFNGKLGDTFNVPFCLRDGKIYRDGKPWPLP